ncbi:MAG: Uncharacterised protein [SAR116 cluster bacterium]|nr:MAG: Uncharacterised protein [SAR116 cluster bacterium]
MNIGTGGRGCPRRCKIGAGAVRRSGCQHHQMIGSIDMPHLAGMADQCNRLAK